MAKQHKYQTSLIARSILMREAMNLDNMKLVANLTILNLRKKKIDNF